MTPGALLAPALAVAAGAAILVSHPPFGWWGATFLGPGLLLAALWADRHAAGGKSGLRRGFGLGVLFGLTCFGPMLSWLILPAGWVGWGLLVAVQAAWFGLLAMLVVPWLEHRALPLVLAVVWTGIDAWRAITPLNGFEWGAIAYAHVDGSWLLPVARLTGGRGITLLVVLIGAAAAVVIREVVTSLRSRACTPMEEVLRRARVPLAMLVGGLFVSVLATIEPPAEVGTIDVLAVQGNEVRHWERASPDPDPPLRITTALRDETLAAVERDGVPELTVWPESSIDRDPFHGRGTVLGELAGETAAVVGELLTGVSLDGEENPATQRMIGALLLEDGFVETDRYLKRRLVPFGEYVPLRWLVGWFPPLEQVPRDAQPGEGPQTIVLSSGVRAAVIICFETKFMDIVRSNVRGDDGPAQILLTLTNDASFGDSAEPAQHLAQTRLRAVETGRWAVHAALTGSTAFVDPHGVATEATELFTIDSIRAEVPLVDGLTPYLVVGDVVGWATRAAVLAFVVIALGGPLRRRVAPESELRAPGR